MKSKTIVFIHGMYMTPWCWEHWIPYFESKGYMCVAPAWPAHDAPVDALRKAHPQPALGALTLNDVLDGYTHAIQKLDQKPILVGHSLGGLVAQLLLQKELAVAAVAIDSAAPAGVLTLKRPFFKSNWAHINPFVAVDNPIEMTFERFQYAFVNTLPLAEQQAAFDKYVVPESRRVPRDSLLAGLDFKRPHPPLLFIAGSADHLIPASLNKANHSRYKDGASITDFKEFAGRSHFILGQAGWEEVADYILAWLGKKVVGENY